MTELKVLDCAQGQRLIMLTFAASAADADLVSAVEQLPFDLLILDSNLKVTYANPGAVERRSARHFGVFGADIDAVERPAGGGLPSRLGGLPLSR